jgi:hypothetical protein
VTFPRMITKPAVPPTSSSCAGERSPVINCRSFVINPRFTLAFQFMFSNSTKHCIFQDTAAAPLIYACNHGRVG